MHSADSGLMGSTLMLLLIKNVKIENLFNNFFYKRTFFNILIYNFSGRTETIQDTLNPVWQKKLVVPYR